MRRIMVALAFCALAITPLPAAEAPEAPAPIDPAEELMHMLHLDVVMNQFLETMLKAQIQANPKLADFEDVMRDFMTKYLSFEGLKPDMIRLYKEHFTDTELREMISFYRTQTGQKCVDQMPSLLQQGGELGRNRVTEHMDELKAAIEARIKEMSKPEKTPPAQETAPVTKDPVGR